MCGTWRRKWPAHQPLIAIRNPLTWALVGLILPSLGGGGGIGTHGCDVRWFVGRPLIAVRNHRCLGARRSEPQVHSLPGEADTIEESRWAEERVTALLPRSAKPPSKPGSSKGPAASRSTSAAAKCSNHTAPGRPHPTSNTLGQERKGPSATLPPRATDPKAILALEVPYIGPRASG